MKIVWNIFLKYLVSLKSVLKDEYCTFCFCFFKVFFFFPFRLPMNFFLYVGFLTFKSVHSNPWHDVNFFNIFECIQINFHTLGERIAAEGNISLRTDPFYLDEATIYLANNGKFKFFGFNFDYKSVFLHKLTTKKEIVNPTCMYFLCLPMDSVLMEIFAKYFVVKEMCDLQTFSNKIRLSGY